MAEVQSHQPNDTEAPVSPECSEAALSELLDECEEQFAQLQMLQNDIILTEQDSSENPQEQSVNMLTATEAELKEWQKAEPKLLSANPEMLLVVGRKELQKLGAQLEMVLSCSEAKRDKLRETLKSEQKLLEEQNELLVAATDQVERQKQRNRQFSEHGVLQETKEKIQKMRDYQGSLMETLADVLEDHAPLPQNETSPNKKKKNIARELDDNLISLHEILQLLMNKLLESPHDPYVTIDDTFWPPYTEMLLRNNIVVRHPEDWSKIRLETC